MEDDGLGERFGVSESSQTSPATELMQIVFLPAKLHSGSSLSMRWRVRTRENCNCFKSHAIADEDTCPILSLRSGVDNYRRS